MTDNKESNRKKGEGHSKGRQKEFLHTRPYKQDLGELHKNYLGMEVPEGYFSSSKSRILDALPSKEVIEEKISGKINKQRRGRLFGLKRTVIYPLAASILLLIAITIGIKNDSRMEVPEADATVIAAREALEGTDDFLRRSLLVEDAEIDQYTDDYLVDQIIVRAELSEQELENIFINSLFVDDSLVDEFLEESLLEQVVM